MGWSHEGRTCHPGFRQQWQVCSFWSKDWEAQDNACSNAQSVFANGGTLSWQQEGHWCGWKTSTWLSHNSFQTGMVYRRDGAAVSLLVLEKLIIEIETGLFNPDDTRSGGSKTLPLVKNLQMLPEPSHEKLNVAPEFYTPLCSLCFSRSREWSFVFFACCCFRPSLKHKTETETHDMAVRNSMSFW